MITKQQWHSFTVVKKTTHYLVWYPVWDRSVPMWAANFPNYSQGDLQSSFSLRTNNSHL